MTVPLKVPTASSARAALTVTPPAPWSPLTLAPTLWADASDVASIISSANKASQIGDKSGNAFHLTQPTAGKQFATGTATVNGRNVLVASQAASQWMAVTFPAIAQPVTILCVMVENNGLSGTFHDSNDPANRVQTFITGGANNMGMYAGTVTGSGGTFTPGTPFQFVAVFNGPSSVIYKNGTAGATLNPGTQTLHGLTIGTDSGRAGPFEGAYCEIVVVPGVISAPNRASWNTYCSRWGL